MLTDLHKRLGIIIIIIIYIKNQQIFTKHKQRCFIGFSIENREIFFYEYYKSYITYRDIHNV